MKKTFEHLLGLNAKDALALLAGCGIFDVRITYTHAPKRPAPPGAYAAFDADGKTMLQAVAENFSVSDGEAPYDPLLEPDMDDGMLTEARVIGVRDDGRQLIVSRFRVSTKAAPADEE